MTTEIGVIAGNHEQFLSWIDEDCRFPSSLCRQSRNVFTTPTMTVRYLASPYSARGITFDLIIMTGRYADKWSDNDIDFLHLNLG